MWGGHIMPTCREEKTEVEQCAHGHIAEKIQSQELECLHAKLLLSYWTLCNPMDCSPPGFSVYGVLQARILEWIAMPSSRDLSDSGIKPRPRMSPELAGRFFTTSAIWEAPRGRVAHSNSQHTAVSPCLACTFSSRANSFTE